MLCPLDKVVLVISERSGIEIDYCPTCRGVWLDRGELDKLIDASDQRSAKPVDFAQTRQEEPRTRKYEDDYCDNHRGKRKKESFLGDLFDF